MTNTVTITLTETEAHMVYDYLTELAFDGAADVFDDDIEPLITISHKIESIIYPENT
jgi:hypothetical protein